MSTPAKVIEDALAATGARNVGDLSIMIGRKPSTIAVALYRKQLSSDTFLRLWSLVEQKGEVPESFVEYRKSLVLSEVA